MFSCLIHIPVLHYHSAYYYYCVCAQLACAIRNVNPTIRSGCMVGSPLTAFALALTD